MSEDDVEAELVDGDSAPERQPPGTFTPRLIHVVEVIDRAVMCVEVRGVNYVLKDPAPDGMRMWSATGFPSAASCIPFMAYAPTLDSIRTNLGTASLSGP